MNGRVTMNRMRGGRGGGYLSLYGWSSLRVLMAPAAPAILYGPVSGQVVARLFSVDVQEGTMWWAVGLSAAMLCVVLGWALRRVLYLRKWDPAAQQYNEGGSGRTAGAGPYPVNYGFDDVYPTLCLGPALLLSHRSLGIPLDAVVLGMLPVIGITGCFARSASECVCAGGCGGHSAGASFILDILGCLQAVAVAALMPGFFFLSRWNLPASRWCVDNGAAAGQGEGSGVVEVVWSVLWLVFYLAVVARYVVLDRASVAIMGGGGGGGGRRNGWDLWNVQWWAVAALVRLVVVAAAVMLGEHIIMSLGVSSILFSCFCGCAAGAGDGNGNSGEGGSSGSDDDDGQGTATTVANGDSDEESMVPERILVASMVGLLGLVFAGSVAVGEDALLGCRVEGVHRGVAREAGLWPVMLGAYVLLFEAVRA